VVRAKEKFGRLSYCPGPPLATGLVARLPWGRRDSILVPPVPLHQQQC